MRLRWFVALSSVLLVVVGLTVAIYDNLDRNTEGGDQVVSDDGGDTGLPSGQVDVTSSGTLEVAGHVSALHLEDAVLQPREVATPLTISSDRGFGNGGEVVGVEVAGKPSSVVWDGGRPFVLSSGPGIRLDPVIVDLVDGEVRCALGGGAHTVLPGDYQLDTPVAVGGSGIATPRDAVAFTAGSKAAFEGRGDAALVLAQDASHHFTGPGRVHLVGDLVVTTEQGDQVATSLDLASGPYDLTLSPTEGGGWTVSGHVQSQVVGDLKLNAQR